MRHHGELRARFVSAEEAVALVPDGGRLLIEASGGGVLEPDLLLSALGDRFAHTATPTGISAMSCSGVGNRAGSGIDHLAQPGLLARMVAGHWAMSPKLASMAQDGEFEAYNLPQGVLAQLLRETAAGRPGLFTRTGLGTFCDPRVDGGRLNDRTTEQLVRATEIDGEEFLHYRAPRFDVGFIRGTTADEKGNITLEQEAAKLGVLAAATAVRNSGGIVIAQVKRVARAGSLKAKEVVVPAHLVDYVVVHPEQRQTAETDYEPAFSGEVAVPLGMTEPLPLTERAVVARRAAAMIPLGAVVNLGVGMADGVAAIVAEEGRLDELTLTVEQGLVGGVPARGVIFGVAWNPEAVVEHAAQFDFYDGGGLDVACLGFAEVDALGNVNSSLINGRVFGAGGFINISQSAHRVVFCGTLTAGGLRTEIGDGRLTVVTEGRVRKFVPRVHQLTFSAERALARGQEVFYVTERAVFELTERGVALREVAPGQTVEAVVALMDFEPIVDGHVGTMPDRLFRSPDPSPNPTDVEVLP
ncbi:acyl CoA:acetate/3-ketoacid CoA transferase [Saccharopolyspora spinosa]|uniref:Acetate CoA-transferase n=1 Tax=Saccharopolyspora spinosa TaxID=60894 RepID=A0A2N3XXY8_SACSN|nr:acyl CoA:acetate/3-ketoacid CoA transferase [Saccharopolyspora spinosa]PKW15547.1 acetate CoA-transferase [Saccharopolyspora spinosa]